MRPRIFWTLLGSFALVIVLGICGMLGFVGLALSGTWQPSPLRETVGQTQKVYGEFLGDYYRANGDSWRGVEQRLGELPLVGGTNNYLMVDNDGRMIAGNDQLRHTTERGANREQVGVPILADGVQIGTLIIGSDLSGPSNSPRSFFGAVARSFLFAGLGLASVLLLLAVLLSRWLAQPLRNVTEAARGVASGQLDVQVSGARIRELDDLAQAFNRMARSLNDADRQRRQMTADIAHELRTPLTIIKGRLEGLQDGIYQPTPEQISKLLAETALLERLIEDLRILALAEAGQLPLYVQPTDLAELLDGVAASFADQAAAHQIALQLALDSDLPLVLIDAQRIQQVLGNIVSNALRHTPPHGCVKLLARQQGEAALVQIQDTGSGIAADDLPLVFDRFWRADRARTRGGGSGLGLAIAKQIVLAHGGTIQASSTVGEGTIVTITLPIERSLQPVLAYTSRLQRNEAFRSREPE